MFHVEVDISGATKSKKLHFSDVYLPFWYRSASLQQRLASTIAVSHEAVVLSWSSCSGPLWHRPLPPAKRPCARK